ncbi:DUF4912 domain-containing protein [Aquisphaera insulae]|uniref:DUF4912 domain-containing protein n=1 Tax=Aquisphaera insulae TaxID=2712864 RepID=UPI0013EAE567|nr:DUF4912 domain-containing protein [Aquisphaera insulae]
MRVALVGWDLDDSLIAALAGLGAEVVGFTRWFPGMPTHELRDGWTLLRCPHRIGESERNEARDFGVATVREASTSGTGFEFDVVHALDRRSRDAAAELSSRKPGSVFLASLDAADAGLEDESGVGLRSSPRGWICDHPWVAECLRERIPAEIPVRVVLRCETADAADAPESSPPSVFVSLARRSRIAPRVVAAALDGLRETVPAVRVVLFGIGPKAEELRHRLDRSGLLAAPAGGSREAWDRALSAAAVVGVDSRSPAESPVARLAWMAGRPTVGLLGGDRGELVRALHAALSDGRSGRDVEVGRRISVRDLEPAARAARWMEIYLDARMRGTSGRARRGSGRGNGLAFPELRSRLALTAISPHEVLASWSLRKGDWEVALEWVGPEAIRAVAAIRLYDVTDIDFDGRNAHDAWDVELGHGEDHRVISVRSDGRSLASCLGLKTPSGHFHPLVHSKLCHLPREGLAPSLPGRRFRVMPRRDPP